MATRGKKLSDAYLELRADDSKLSGDVKVKATKAAKGFGAQLNNALKVLDIDAVDVKADPKSALAAIEATRERLRVMSRDAESVEMRVRTERALTQLERFRRQLGQVDDEPVKIEADPSPAQRQVEQLRRQLVGLGIDPIDVDADPAAALAALKRVDEQLEKLSQDAGTVHVRVDAESARTAVARLRQQLGDVGDDPVEVKVDPSPAQRQVDQLQKRLAALGIDPPVQIDADPKAALAAVKRVDDELEKLSKSASTVQLRMDAQSARTDLGRLRQQITDVGEESATGFAARFGARVGPLLASMPLSPPLLAAVGVAAAAAAPLLAGAVASAMVGGAAGGGIVGGAILAARDQRVMNAGRELGQFMLGDLEARAGSFVPVMLDGIARVRAGWVQLGPDLDRIFASSRLVDPLVAGAVSGARHLIGGVADAVDEAEPIVAAFGAGLEQLGDATGDVLSLLASDSDEAASALNDITSSIASMIRVAGGIAHVALVVKGWTDQLDTAVDTGRYWLEDMKHYRGWLDLTADGFKVGSKEALAYREATLGTADAQDFATLKAAGMTDAQIAAADASGTFRQKTDEVARALGVSGDALVATEDDVKQLQSQLEATGVRMEMFGDIGTSAFTGLLLSTGAVTGAMLRQKTTADQLRQAHEQMYGAVIGQTEANETYESSWDTLSETVKSNSDQIGANKNNLDIHTKAGRSNRDALQELLTKSGEMYYADIEAGMAIDEARKKHEERTGAIRTEAGQLKLNKTETEKLIGTYGNIPPKKTTDLLLDGVEQVGKILTDLYIFQRSLATGRTLAQVRSDVFGGYAGDPRVFKREGGEITGQGLKGVDSEPIIAAPGEFMQPVPAVDYYGVAAMQAIRHRQIPKEALQGYATGGLIDRLRGRDWGSRMRYETDVHRTRVPSRAEVASKVTPAFGAWPSSPGAQRGDSGVWRQIMAMVKGSGIPYTFGNAYRPGDPLWHGSGRAVDFMGYNQDRLAQFFTSRQAKVLELIHRTDSRDYAVSRGRRTSMPTQLPLHKNHLHVAMDNGGYLMPGWNPPIYNGTGRPEPVTPAPIMDVVIERLEELIGAVEQIAPGVGEQLTGGVASARQLGRARGWALSR